MFYPILIHSRHSEPPQGSFGGHDGFISQPLTVAAPGRPFSSSWVACKAIRYSVATPTRLTRTNPPLHRPRRSAGVHRFQDEVAISLVLARYVGGSIYRRATNSSSYAAYRQPSCGSPVSRHSTSENSRPTRNRSSSVGSQYTVVAEPSNSIQSSPTWTVPLTETTVFNANGSKAWIPSPVLLWSTSRATKNRSPAVMVRQCVRSGLLRGSVRRRGDSPA